jgi:hypothetical protein
MKVSTMLMGEPIPLAEPQDRKLEEIAAKTVAARRRRPPVVGWCCESCCKKLVNGKWQWLGARNGYWERWGEPFTIYARLG